MATHSSVLAWRIPGTGGPGGVPRIPVLPPSQSDLKQVANKFAWKIPRTEEPGRLQSMGSLRVDMTERLHFHALEKEMATHSSVLAWRIPGVGKPGGLPSMGVHSVRHG